MSLIKCTECNDSISNLAGHCPNCGAPMNQAVREATEISMAVKGTKSIGKYVMYAVFVFGALAILGKVFDLLSGEQQARQNTAVVRQYLQQQDR